jgi:hypothetical protein
MQKLSHGKQAGSGDALFASVAEIDDAAAVELLVV